MCWCYSFVAFNEDPNHLFKLIEVNETVPVQVHLLNNFLPHCLILAHVVSQDLGYLLR